MEKTNNKVRIGILGAGKVAREIHLPVIKNMSNAEIIWLCDVSPVAATAANAYVPGARVHNSIDDCEPVDVVLVTIPVGYRRDPLLKVIGRGWNVLCEKPFAVTLAEHDEYLLKAMQARVNVGVGLMRRYYKQTCLARDILESGVFGVVQEVWASQGSKVIRTGRENNYQADKNASGGGVLMETGVHLVDQVFAILGVQTFNIVDAKQKVYNGLDFEMNAVVDLELASQNNVRFNLELSNINELYFGIVVRTTQAVLKIGVLADRHVILCSMDGKPLAYLGGERGADTAYQAFYMEWTDFIRQCFSADGYKSAVSAESARKTTEFIDRCYKEAGQIAIGK